MSYKKSTAGEARPFLKWAGGKSQLLKELRSYYCFDGQITKYAEPFVGGGAILFDVLNQCDIQAAYISDVNRELICTYMTVRDSINDLISRLKKLESDYLSLDSETRRLYYNNKRSEFNNLKHNRCYGPELAALMIFLNRTCFNGLYRVNKSGQFNVPSGKYVNPVICDEINLRMASEKLQRVEIICGGYWESDRFIDGHTLAYFDPPYRPLTASSFAAYDESGFDDNAQVELAGFINTITKRGAKIVMSNSDPKNSDKNDNFFDDLYAGYKIRRVDAARMINSKGDGRGAVKELIVSNF